MGALGINSSINTRVVFNMNASIYVEKNISIKNPAPDLLSDMGDKLLHTKENDNSEFPEE